MTTKTDSELALEALSGLNLRAILAAKTVKDHETVDALYHIIRAALEQKQDGDFTYLMDHHHITETSMGFALAHIKNGEYSRAKDRLEHAVVKIDELREAKSLLKTNEGEEK